MALAHVTASCSQPVPPHRPTWHTAAVGSGNWLPPSCLPAATEARLRSLSASGWQICSPSRFGDGCLLLASLTCLRFQGQVREAIGFSSPSRNSLLRSNSLTFPQRLSALGGGMTAPLDRDLFLLTAAFPSQQLFSTLISAEAGRQQEEEAGARRGGLESSPGAQQGEQSSFTS